MNDPSISMPWHDRRLSPAEEWVNTLTHGVGLLLSVAALVYLTVCASHRGDAWYVVSSCIYGATLVLLYAASTVYHGFPAHPRRHVLHLFDHAAIYLLIAGTYTPFALVTLRGERGWTLLALIWSFALIGILYTVRFAGRSRAFRLIAPIIYLAMGWLALLVLWPLARLLPYHGIHWLLAGGLFYTGGLLFYAWRRLYYHHAIWHVFVLLGSLCHFLCIVYYVIPG